MNEIESESLNSNLNNLVSLISKQFVKYNVLNCSSPISVTTRLRNVVISHGTINNPSKMKFTIEEIEDIAETSAFKIGLLNFEKHQEEFLYNAIELFDWKDILTNEQIEDILINPTYEGTVKILNITNEQYFNRIVGAYIGLKNAGIDYSGKIQCIIEERQKEFKRGIKRTEIKVKKII